MASEFALTVNGTRRTVQTSGDIPVLYVLRNDLKLTSVRLGCGVAQCGACAVLVDGREVRACVTPVSQMVGKKIHTIEGLPALWAGERRLTAAEAASTLHPVQQAWIDEVS